MNDIVILSSNDTVMIEIGEIDISIYSWLVVTDIDIVRLLGILISTFGGGSIF